MASPANADESPECTDELLAGITSVYDRSEMRAQMAIDDASMLRRAAQTVWCRHCNQHHCTEGLECTHPDHRRDRDYLEDRLVMLGIKPGSESTCSPAIGLSHVDS